MVSRAKKRFVELLKLEDPPKRTALAFSIGVFIAFSPILGFHTLLALLAAWVFRLNLIAIFIGAFVNNPWTFAPLYGACLWAGIYLYGGSSVFPKISWHHITFFEFLKDLKPYIGPFFLGTTVIGTIFAVLSYFLAYFFIDHFKKSKTEIGFKEGN